MAKKIQLMSNEDYVLLKLTHRAKMNWFNIDNQLRCRDLENNNRIISTRKAVKQIVEGLTAYDIGCLTIFEVLTLLNLLNRM